MCAAQIELATARELGAFDSHDGATQPTRTLCLDIAAFLESHLGVDLDLDASLPDEVLGEVVFRRGGRVCVAISAALTREAERAQGEGRDHNRTVIGRWRMTLAHEAAHVILHAPLFESQIRQSEPQWSENGPSEGAIIQRCYKRESASHESAGEWLREEFCEADFERERAHFERVFGAGCRALAREKRERARLEWQANRGAAALLMPEQLFRREAETLMAHAQTSAPHFCHAQHLEWRLSRLAARFGVSSGAALVRARALGFETP